MGNSSSIQGNRGTSSSSTSENINIDSKNSSQGIGSKFLNRLSSIRKALVSNSSLAPREINPDGVECPICFVNYVSVNTTKCCQQIICSDCFIEIKRKQPKGICPFCSVNKFSVSFKATNSSISAESNTIQRIQILPEPSKAEPVIDTTNFATAEDRRKIEEEISKTRNAYQDDYLPASLSAAPFATYRPNSVMRRQQSYQTRRNGSSNSSSSMTTSSAGAESSRPSSISTRIPNQSLADRLDRILHYYQGGAIIEDDEILDEELIMTLSDIASSGTGHRHSVSTNSERDFEYRSHSSRNSYEPTDAIIESMMISGNVNSYEELEELMLLEAMRISIEESKCSNNANSNDEENQSVQENSSSVS